MAKTKALVSCVTGQLIWAFVFAYAKSRFSHAVAHLMDGPGRSGVLTLILELEISVCLFGF